MSTKVESDLNDGVYTITLNNPKKHNCIGWDMLEGLDKCIEEAEHNEEVRVIVFKGAGEKSFSSGADLKEFGALDKKGAKRWIVFGNKVFNRIETIAKPTIAALKGYVIGGGLELALACDFRICTDNAIFAFPEVVNGWLPGWGGLARLKRLIGESQAKKLILLGEKTPVSHIHHTGLVTEMVSTESLEQKLGEHIQKLKSMKPFVYELAKKALHDESRETDGIDLLFDVLALNLAESE